MMAGKFLVLLSLFAVSLAKTREVELGANPIRKIVTLLQDMQKEISAEHDKEKELYDKFMCFCEQTDQELKGQADTASSKIDEAQAKMEEDTSSKNAIDQELATHKQDRDDARNELQKATAIRNKEAEEFEESEAAAKRNVAALGGAIPALEKGMGAGALLQTAAGDEIKRLVQTSASLSSFDRENVIAFLDNRANGDYVPQSGQIVGILKTMEDDMTKSLAQSQKDEANSAAAYADLKAAKNKEISVASGAIESKTSQSGELAVLIVQSKDTLADTEAELADAKKYIASLATQCMDKQKEWTARQAIRAQEVSAISEAITILNDDDALDIFKKAAPASFLSTRPSSWGFLQSKRVKESPLVKAHSIVQDLAHNYKSVNLELLSYTVSSKLALARRSGAQNFDLINGLLDNMVKNLVKEGEDDEKHKEYCEVEFAENAQEAKDTQEHLNAQNSQESELKDQVDTIANEMTTLSNEITAMDGSVAAASLQRKKESAEYTQMMTLNEAAIQLIDKAKNRLAKFYNPTLYKEEPKKELAADDRIMANMGYAVEEQPASFAQVRSHHQKKIAPPIPPETFGAYTKKGEKSQGVVALMDMLSKDLKDDMASAEHDEKMSQKEYQELMTTSAETRSQNTKSITDKSAAKATLEAKLVEVKNGKMLTVEELGQIHEYTATLHQSCDFIMDNFDLRKAARTNEEESLKNAKSVLAGANFN